MSDSDFMQLALAQAQQAAAAGEVPVGAVVVKDGTVIATGRNAPIYTQDPTAHAEILALRAAAKALGNYRLEGCELFVTLEPCIMCAGAMLHSRLQRVVFGASDPRTGAAGSVLNVFEQAQLNHQTGVLGGVLEQASSALLQTFFQGKRDEAKAALHPLRDDALRTPESCFESLPDYPWPARYISDLPALAGLRMHYLDEAKVAVPNLTYLCLHGPTSWSYHYRLVVAKWLAQGHRVLAPDLIGFGKSDKPKKDSFHQWAWHRQVLLEFVQRLDLHHIVLVQPTWAQAFDLSASAPQRFIEQLDMNPATDPTSAGDNAPYPDRGHRAALRAFAQEAGRSMRYSRS